MTTLTKTYFTKQEAMEDIITVLESGYDSYLSDLHSEVFNTEYYIYDDLEAEQALEQYGVFNAIREVKQYEMDNFGEIYTDLSNPIKIVNMLYYIIGEEALYEISDNLIEAMESDLVGDYERELLLTTAKELVKY